MSCEKREGPVDSSNDDLQLDARLRRVERIIAGLASLDERHDRTAPAAESPRRDLVSALLADQYQPPLVSLFDNEIVSIQTIYPALLPSYEISLARRTDWSLLSAMATQVRSNLVASLPSPKWIRSDAP